MRTSRRTTLGAAGAAMVAAVTAMAASAAGLVGTDPGSYQLNDITAFANFQPRPGQSASVTVEQGTFVFTPSGGPTTTTHATVLDLQMFASTGGSNGCFVIPDSSLTQNPVAHTVTLQATLTADEMVSQSPLPLEADLNGVPIPQGAPFGVCFPDSGSFTFPMTVDTTWTFQNPTTSVAKSGTWSCGSYTEQYKIANTYHGATATTTMGGGATTSATNTAMEQLTAVVIGGPFPHVCQLPVF